MKLIKKQCKECRVNILIRPYDHKRNRGKFCSKRCAAIFNNKIRKNNTLKCRICDNPFTSKTKHAKYCSDKCRKSKQKKVKKKYRYHLSTRIRSKYGSLPCFECGWNESICDIHHIKPRSKGGSDEPSNLAFLCPNHHRLVHRKKLTVKKTLASFKPKKEKSNNSKKQ